MGGTAPDTDPPWNAVYCATCGATGRRGYCAPAACVCGHSACYAFASWVPRPPLPTVVPMRKRKGG